MGELAKSGMLLGGDGLRASSQGVRLTCSKGTCTVTPGPLTGNNELPAGFTAIRTASLDEAIAFAKQQAEVLGDVEMDIRPLTEAHDIGIAPKPANETTRRWMVLRKADAAYESGKPLSVENRKKLDAVRTRAGASHLQTVTLTPSARGRRYKNTQDGMRVIDGPFAESKELIAGYVMIESPSLDDASRFAEKYISVVGTGEVDVREVDEIV